MTAFIIISIILLATITLLAFKVLLYPKICLQQMKKLYGNKIHIIHHYGLGLLKEYKQNLRKNNDSAYFIKNLSKENPSLQACGFNIGAKVGITFFDPQLIKQVHMNHDSFRMMDTNKSISYLFDSSLLLEKGESWHKQRRFLGKTFHFDEIKKRIPEIKTISQSFLSNLDLTKSENLKEIQVIKQCEKVTSEVVFRTFFGCKLDNLTVQTPRGEISIAHEISHIIQDSYNLTQSSNYVMLKQFLLKQYSSSFFPIKEEKQIWTRLHNLKSKCIEIVRNRKKELKEDISKSKDTILDLYLKEIILDENSTITEKEIVGNFMVLFFAGTDTTANMVGNALYFLSLNPEVQKKARNEVISLLSQTKKESTNMNELFERIDFENISNFNYLQAVLKESLRITPPAICIFIRQALQDIRIGDFQLRKGDMVNTHFLFNQSNPSIFENPDEFKPERWFGDAQTIAGYNFTPFSSGPRNCIGQHLSMIEGKIMLAHILLNYDIQPNLKENYSREVYLVYHLTPDNFCFFKKRINQK